MESLDRCFANTPHTSPQQERAAALCERLSGIKGLLETGNDEEVPDKLAGMRAWLESAKIPATQRERATALAEDLASIAALLVARDTISAREYLERMCRNLARAAKP